MGTPLLRLQSAQRPQPQAQEAPIADADGTCSVFAIVFGFRKCKSFLKSEMYQDGR